MSSTSGASSSSSSSSSAQRRVGIALCGVGYWGKNYLRALKEMPDHFRLLYVVDQSVDTLRAHQRRHQNAEVEATSGTAPDILFTTNLEEALRDERVEAVCVTTPAWTHADLAIRSLNAGKHVLVEKPLATNSEDAKRIVELGRQVGKQVLVGFTVLFVPAVIKAKEIIGSPDFGTPYFCYSSRTNLGIVRQDVNVNWELAPHDISVFQHWLQSKPLWVSAVGSKFLGENEDTIFVTLRYENGVTANMMFSWADPKKSRENVIVSSNMRLSVDDIDVMGPLRIHKKAIDRVPVAVSAREADSNYGNFKLITKDGDLLIPSLNFSEPLKNKLTHLCECVRAGVDQMTPINNGLLGLLVCRVCEAIDQSMKVNGSPVNIVTDDLQLPY